MIRGAKGWKNKIKSSRVRLLPFIQGINVLCHGFTKRLDTKIPFAGEKGGITKDLLPLLPLLKGYIFHIRLGYLYQFYLVPTSTFSTN
jgi:hypothetical protein